MRLKELIRVVGSYLNVCYSRHLILAVTTPACCLHFNVSGTISGVLGHLVSQIFSLENGELVNHLGSGCLYVYIYNGSNRLVVEKKVKLYSLPLVQEIL